MDFSLVSDSIEEDVSTVSRLLLEHGVTSYCPTIVTSPVEVYKKVWQSTCMKCLQDMFNIDGCVNV